MKLYLPEPNSARAVALIHAIGEAPVVTPLHELEMRSAVRQKVGRHEITESECQSTLEAFDRDLTGGVLVRRSPRWENVFAVFESLSRQHTAVTLCRTLDTLHVALAVEMGMTEFCSFDQRQATMARLAGLAVVS